MSAFVINSYRFTNFLPTDLSNLVVWLDATKGLYDATSGGSAVSADSATVARWEDQSGNGNHMTQSDSASRPTLKTAIQNSLNVLRWDGNKTRMSCSNLGLFNNVPGASVFAVRKWSSSPTTERGIFYASTNSSDVVRVYLGGGLASGKAFAGGRRLDANTLQRVDSAANVSTSSFELEGAILDYANSDIYLYTNALLSNSSTSFQTDGNSQANNSKYIGVGGSVPSAGYGIVGDIAECIVYNRALTESERKSVENYLNAKWSIY